MPKGTKNWRVQQAIHRFYTSGETRHEIAEDLDVHPGTVTNYINSGPDQEVVNEMMRKARDETRVIAVNELKRQLMEAGERSRSAKKPIKVWQDEHGNVNVRDVRNDSGQLVDREPVPFDVEILPDEDARYISRREVREILDRLVKLTGAQEPEQHQIQIVDKWKESAHDS